MNNVELNKIVALNRNISHFRYKDKEWYLWGDRDLTNIVQSVQQKMKLDMKNEVDKNIAVSLALREYFKLNGVADQHNVSLYNLCMYDTQSLSFDFVVQFLNHVLSIDPERGQEIAAQIHANGHAFVGPYTMEVVSTVKAYMRQIEMDNDVSMRIDIHSPEDEANQMAFELLQNLIKQNYPEDI